LARVTRHVVGTRRALDELIEDQRGTTERVSQLTRDFEAALIRVDDKFAQVDSRLDRLEQGQQLADLRHLADHSFTESVEAWGFRQTYHDLPWACQVVLLAKEVVNGPVSLLEMVDGEPSYRERLVRHILQHDAIPSPRTPLVIATLFDDVAAELRSSGYDEFVAELLESGLTGGLMMPVGPLTALVRTTLELWVDHGGPSERLGQQALSIVRERYGWVDGTADVESFVRRVVTEQADAARALRSAWSGDDDE
jgi:hypothetical protein